MNRFIMFCAVCLFSFLVLPTDSMSQANRQPAGGKAGGTSSRTVQRGDEADSKDAFRFKKFTALDRNTYLKTPKFDPSQQPGTSREREWMQFAVHYDTSSEWIDAVVFQYYVLSEKVENGKKAYSLFKKSVRYIDIARGRAHISDVYLHPKALERFGKVVAAGFEATIEGKAVAKDSKFEGIKLSSEWWTKITDNESVTVRDGYLLDRGETPFALSNIDDYELIKR